MPTHRGHRVSPSRPASSGDGSSQDDRHTLEANPGTFEADKFAAYRRIGINRLSIGIQSFDPGHLQALGRIHAAQDAVRAVEIAHAEFENINLDLMYAQPGQTLAQALADSDHAIRLRPTHIRPIT